MARGDSGREPLPEAGGSGNKLAAPAKLATLSLGGPWVRTEKLASPSPICCWAASISLPFFIDDCRPVPVRRPACSAGVYVAEPSPSPPAAGSETERWMSPSATASSGGVRGGGGGGGGAASWGRETAALARLRACLLGELISSLGSEGAEASRRPNGPSTMHRRAVGLGRGQQELCQHQGVKSRSGRKHFTSRGKPSARIFLKAQDAGRAGRSSFSTLKSTTASSRAGVALGA